MSDGDVRWRVLTTRIRDAEISRSAHSNLCLLLIIAMPNGSELSRSGHYRLCRRGCEDVPGIVGIREAQPRRIRATAACEVTSVV